MMLSNRMPFCLGSDFDICCKVAAWRHESSIESRRRTYRVRHGDPTHKITTRKRGVAQQNSVSVGDDCRISPMAYVLRT